MLHIHIINLHAGPLSTLAQIRFTAWIPSGKRTVKNVIHNYCQTCKRYSAIAFQAPPVPNLPSERVTRSKLFKNVGLDYCGLFNVKEKNEISKVWIALFTCMTVRAWK